MGNPRGFIKFNREVAKYRPVCERVKDYRSVCVPRFEDQSEEQASRCMDCGTPFCHWGCPLGNYIPEWNDLLFSGQWKRAYELLAATNAMPEITGKICPAPCEYSCVLALNDDPVTIRENEQDIIEHAFRQGWVTPHLPGVRSGKRVAVVGSGPAGLAAAARLNRLGHSITVFERADKIGGILRYGIPDFKLEKSVLDRRIDIWKKEGIEFNTGVNVGVDLTHSNLLSRYDAVLLAGGSRIPRDLKIEGREFKGMHFAMDYLTQSNRMVAGDTFPEDQIISAKDKRVVVIGGGDTGADCVGTANRQGASCVVQIEVLPKPAETRTDIYPWPIYPLILKNTSSHEEGVTREWQIQTKRFIGEDGRIKKLLCFRVDSNLAEIPGTEFEIEVDLIILAIGFLHPERDGLLSRIEVEFSKRGNVLTDQNYMTSLKGIFSAGDMRRGQSLVVWALYEGDQAAKAIDRYFK